MYDALLPRVFAALVRTVVASPLPEAGWFSAAEAAVTALYALHPSPEHLSAAMLRHLARAAFSPAAAAGADGGAGQGEAMDAEGPAAEGGAGGGEAEEDDAPAPRDDAGQQGSPRALHSVSALSRFLFVLGHVALQHLVSPGYSEGVLCFR